MEQIGEFVIASSKTLDTFMHIHITIPYLEMPQDVYSFTTDV